MNSFANRYVLVFAVGLLAVAVPGCSLFEADDTPALVGTPWRLVAFLADDAFPPPSTALCQAGGVRCVDDGRVYSVTFRPDGGVGVRADCNTCGGTYEHDGAALHINTLICTEVYCGRASHGSDFAQALSRAQRVVRREEQLLIAYGSERGLLLRATRPPEAPPRSR